MYVAFRKFHPSTFHMFFKDNAHDRMVMDYQIKLGSIKRAMSPVTAETALWTLLHEP